MVTKKEGILRTSADDLFELVKSRGKISVDEAARLLKLPQETVQGLVDFLVEDKFFGLEYKFTTPYIYLSREFKVKPSHEPKRLSVANKLATKEFFYERAKHKGIHNQKIHDLWNKYLNQNLKNIKNEFYKKARLRIKNEPQIDSLWKKYVLYLM